MENQAQYGKSGSIWKNRPNMEKQAQYGYSISGCQYLHVKVFIGYSIFKVLSFNRLKVFFNTFM